MDLNLFATQIVQTGGKSSSAILSGGGLLGGANGLGNINVDFWNVILGNLAEEQTDISAKSGENNLNTDANSTEIKKEKVDLALLQLALLGQDPDVNLDEKLASLRIERVSQSKENRVEQLTKLIQHLTNGLPDAANENTSIENLVSRLTKRLESLQASLDAFRSGDFGDEGAPFKLLIATGLNPAQLTKITNRIEEVEQKLGRELTVDDLIAGVGNIIPVPGDDNEDLTPTDALQILLSKSDDQDELQNASDKTSDADNFSAEADAALGNFTTNDHKSSSADTNNENAAHVGNKKAAAHQNRGDNLGSLLSMIAALKVAPAGTQTAALESTTSTDETNVAVEIPTQLTNAQYNALFSSTNMAKKNLAKLNVGVLGQKVTLPTLPKVGDISLPTNWNDTLSGKSAITDSMGFDIQTGAPFSSTMIATHPAAAASQAGQPHPATQMVAAHVSKAAHNGETKNITLKLDPPELGRVDVRLEFGKDKSVKAHLIVEKQETLLMLQRDASALERALQNAGLETDSGSLNYQMAQDNYAFNSNGDGRGQNGHASGNNTGGAEGIDGEEILQTTLTWDVDPDTGHVRYNLLA